MDVLKFDVEDVSGCYYDTRIEIYNPETEMLEEMVEELWWNGKGSERYDYLYSENELNGWRENITQLLRTTSKIFIFFNNHPGGQAVQNARQLNAML